MVKYLTIPDQVWYRNPVKVLLSLRDPVLFKHLCPHIVKYVTTSDHVWLKYQ